MPPTLLEKTEEFVRELFKEKLSPSLLYHDLGHTISVVEAARELAELEGLSDQDRETLMIAAWLHDTGFTEIYAGHEDVSKRIAEEFLTEQGVPAEQIEQVLACIEITKLGNTPDTKLTSVMKDADFNNLGKRNYINTVENLRHERKVYFRESHTDEQWYEGNVNFIKAHEYYTDSGKATYEKRKRKNLKKVKKELKAMKKGKDVDIASSIGTNKSAQMMLKTSLRNHIDLTNIADNKSNIMLSINALIITISMPLLATRVGENPFLLVPTGILLSTCVLSIIFATLATRPIKTTGMTNVSNIGNIRSNLFFFGNYYRMSFEDYREGLQTVVADQKILDDSIIADLFYLGKSLGAKFNRLRICYAIFMVGITLSVISFAVAYAIV